MSLQQPKQALSVMAGLLLLIVIASSCNNSADTTKAPADTVTKAAAIAVDTTKKADTTKMDTATTRPVKSPN